MGTLSSGIWRRVPGNLVLDVVRPILCLETRGPIPSDGVSYPRRVNSLMKGVLNLARPSFV
jgi:hypothetical protein